MIKLYFWATRQDILNERKKRFLTIIRYHLLAKTIELITDDYLIFLVAFSFSYFNSLSATNEIKVINECKCVAGNNSDEIKLLNVRLITKI